MITFFPQLEWVRESPVVLGALIWLATLWVPGVVGRRCGWLVYQLKTELGRDLIYWEIRTIWAAVRVLARLLEGGGPVQISTYLSYMKAPELAVLAWFRSWRVADPWICLLRFNEVFWWDWKAVEELN